MSKTKPSGQPVVLNENCDEHVLTTVFNFGTSTIRKSVHRDTTILEVSGTFSPALGKKLERIAFHVKGNLGLDLGGVSGLQSSLSVSIIKNIQRKLKSREKSFFLCDPPDRLLDFLKLDGLIDHFQIVVGGYITQKSAAISSKSVDSTTTERKKGEASGANPVRKEITHLTQSLKRTEILEKGLDSASRCVRRFLPSRSPQYAGYDFAFLNTPCDKVGGDFFDFIELEKNNLGISIGDVSGHGLDSAIIMGMAKKLIRIRAKEIESPVEVLRRVNKDLFEDLGRRIFVTALYARLNLGDGLLIFARAGHEPPLQFTAGTNGSPVVSHGKGMALGMDPGSGFDTVLDESSLRMSPGDGVLLYTDGIVESFNSRNDLFSRERLSYVLERLPATNAAEDVLERIRLAVDQFSGGTPPEDDMTAIVIMRH